MNELAPTIRPEDIKAAQELAAEATSTTDVSTLREMLVDQNAGTTLITAEDGTSFEVTSVGKEKFAELGHKATEAALSNVPVASESWRTEEK